MSTNEFSNKICGALFVLLAVFTMASTGWAATYYVDHTAGNDSNAGTEVAPWAHCPGLIGWTGSATLTAGDTVYFDRGDTWTSSAGQGQLLLVKGGITYDGETWGTGTKATFTATGNLSGTSSGVIIFFLTGSDHPTIETVVKGFAINGGGASGYNNSGVTLNWPVGGVTLTGATKRVINCDIINTTPVGTTYWTYGILIGAQGNGVTENVEILNCTVAGTGSEGIDNYISAGSTGHTDHVTIRGCSITDTGRIGTNNQGIGLIGDVRHPIVEFNYMHDIGAGIRLAEGGGGCPSNIIVRYNIIKNMADVGIYIPSMPQNVSADFYGNLIINTTNGGIVTKTGAGGQHAYRFYNNTIYLPNTITNPGIRIETTTQTFSVLEVKNNIVWFTSEYGIYDDIGKITAHSNNLLYRTGSGNVAYSNGTNYTASNLTSYEASAYSTNPTFKNTSNLPTGFTGTYGTDMVPNTDGLSISSGNALDHGVNLAVSYNGAINLSGRSGSPTRPISGAPWDIGAYESVSELKPPSNLRIIQ